MPGFVNEGFKWFDSPAQIALQEHICSVKRLLGSVIRSYVLNLTLLNCWILQLKWLFKNVLCHQVLAENISVQQGVQGQTSLRDPSHYF